MSRSAGFRLRRLQHQPFTRSRQADFSFRPALEQFFDDSRGDLGWGALGYFNVDSLHPCFGPFKSSRLRKAGKATRPSANRIRRREISACILHGDEDSAVLCKVRGHGFGGFKRGLIGGDGLFFCLERL